MSFVELYNTAVPTGGVFLVIITAALAILSIVNLAMDSNSRKILNISRMVAFILLSVQSTFVFFPTPDKYLENGGMWESIIIFSKLIVIILAYVTFAVYLVLETNYLSKKRRH